MAFSTRQKHQRYCCANFAVDQYSKPDSVDQATAADGWCFSMHCEDANSEDITVLLYKTMEWIHEAARKVENPWKWVEACERNLQEACGFYQSFLAMNSLGLWGFVLGNFVGDEKLHNSMGIWFYRDPYGSNNQPELDPPFCGMGWKPPKPWPWFLRSWDFSPSQNVQK